MITQIGLVAGEIWDYLEKHDKTAAMDDIVRGLERERGLMLMSIGWLSREHHVTLEGDFPNFTVKLIG